MKAHILPLLTVILFVVGCETTGESRHERKRQEIESSAAPTHVAGGEKFESEEPYDLLFDKILTVLKKRDYTIDSANKETGQITTTLDITGGWRQTGTRVQVTLIKESAKTTVKVAVTEQQRYKALQIEPWNEPKMNQTKSAELAGQLKNALAAQ